VQNDIQELKTSFSNDSGLPFGKILTRDFVLKCLRNAGHNYRGRIFGPLETLWGWLSQCLSQDKSLNEAVSRILAHRVAAGLPACSGSSASYSNARKRFPEDVLVRMGQTIGQQIHDSAPDSLRWNDRPVIITDGTGLSMPDTPANQAEYPQFSSRKPGLGFPMMRAVALISLATGSVLNLAFCKHKGKGTGESALLRGMLDNLSPGDILLADRYFSSYFMVALLKQRGVDLLSSGHTGRVVDFRTGTKIGPRDHIATWAKPQRPDWMDWQTYQDMPDSIQVREFGTVIENREGNLQEMVVVTTMTDPELNREELADLYKQRWNCEVDLRSIKCSMQLDVLRCKTPEMVRKEIWVHLLAYNLLRGVMMQSATKHNALPRELSVKGAMQAVESFTPVMMNAGGEQPLHDAFLATVSSHRVGNRPGRKEPRFVKRRPRWTKYLTIPRHKSKRRLASEGKTLS